MTTTCDVMIVGAGPVGLAFARLLAGSGLDIVIVEQAELSALKKPAPDGRAIALNHASMDILEKLDAAPRIAPEHRSLLRQAHVLDGDSDFSLVFDAARKKAETLGWLVPNHAIRKALFESFAARGDARLVTGVKADGARPVSGGLKVWLSDGEVYETGLLVAADTRFSALRRQLGLSAFMLDFGRTMIVTDARHEKPHDGTAFECFFHELTIATLPLSGDRSSIVLTVPNHEAETMLAGDLVALMDMVASRLKFRLGAIAPEGEGHAYPLVATYANAFHSERFALIGDAAVGMHPVTAHGFNFGLRSAWGLSRELLEAHRLGLDFAAADVLRRYDHSHRIATFPLFHATNGIASLYSSDAPPARFLRKAGLRIANALPPLKDMVVSRLIARF